MAHNNFVPRSLRKIVFLSTRLVSHSIAKQNRGIDRVQNFTTTSSEYLQKLFNAYSDAPMLYALSI